VTHGQRAALALCVCLIAGLCASPAGARQASPLHIERAARAIARVIRRDARQRARHSVSAVTVTRRCCHVRTLRVHYRVAPSGALRGDSYVLVLSTRRAAIQEVAISESSASAYITAGGGRLKSWSTYEVAIERNAAGRNRWHFFVFLSESAEERPHAGRPSRGSAFSDECAIPAHFVPRLLYREAMRLLRNARLREPSFPQQDPLAACRRHLRS